VLINGYAEGIDAPFISCDDRLAAEWRSPTWSRSGHRRIGFVSGPDRFLNVQRKLAGYRAAMRRELGVRDGELDEWSR
jgi:LacI family repressor for deo operon, udp, cdd, tsx, nupC, and nupG